MIDREIIPRHLSLFEFCKKHNLPLIIERGEHAFKKPYTRLCITGYTGYYYFSRVKYRKIDFEAWSLQTVTSETIDYIVKDGLYINKKLVLKVPPLSYSTEGHEGFNIVQGPIAINFFDWLEKENLTLVISACETVAGKAFTRVELKGYGVVDSYVGDGIRLVLEINAIESKAIRHLVELISETYIAPAYRKNGWSCVDETKKIKVPALF